MLVGRLGVTPFCLKIGLQNTKFKSGAAEQLLPDLRGKRSSNTTCLTQTFFEPGEEFCNLWRSLTPLTARKTREAVLGRWR